MAPLWYIYHDWGGGGGGAIGYLTTQRGGGGYNGKDLNIYRLIVDGCEQFHFRHLATRLQIGSPISMTILKLPLKPIEGELIRLLLYEFNIAIIIRS